MSASRRERPRGVEPSPAAPQRIDRVRKRDGRSVPFVVEKIRDAIQKAMDAVGDVDPSFAGEVASVVELTILERRARDERRSARDERRCARDERRCARDERRCARDERRCAPGSEPFDSSSVEEDLAPHIEEIQDLVEKALMELGRSAVAKAYILYRDKRARIREALAVHSEDAASGSLLVRERQGVMPWSKGRIVAALVDEAELARPLAEEIAGEVERRVFAAGVRRITTGLLRELVASELFERGLTRAVHLSGVVGLPRRDLARVIDGAPLHPWEDRGATSKQGARARIADEILTRHGLEDVLPESVAELHAGGDLEVLGLEALQAPLVLAFEAQLLAPGDGGAAGAWRLFEEISRFSAHVSHGLVLEEPERVLAPLARAARPGSSVGLTGWLSGLASLAQASGIHIDLVGSPRAGAFSLRLIEELLELAPSAFGPRLFLEGHELEAVLAARPDLSTGVDRLLAEGLLVPTFASDRERAAGTLLLRRTGERGAIACSSAIALNLPRLARRAGAYREESVQDGVLALVQRAALAAKALEARQAAFARASGSALAATRSFAVVPIGLREALLVLGDGTLDPDQGSRLLGLLSEATRRVAQREGLIGHASSFAALRAAQRFAWLDRREAQAAGRQRWLFAQAADDSPPAPYSQDYLLAPGAQGASGRAEAALLRTLGAGALELARYRTSEGREALPHLSLWKRFEVLRRSHTGELSLELFRSAEPHAALSSSLRSPA